METTRRNKDVKRGDIYFANLNPTKGKEIRKTRPVLIISNDINNSLSSTVTIVPLTSRTEKIYPFEVLVSKEESGLKKDSKIKCDQIRTIDKLRLATKAGRINKVKITETERAICIHLDINF